MNYYQEISDEEGTPSYSLNNIAQTASNIIGNVENTVSSYIPSLSTSSLYSNEEEGTYTYPYPNTLNAIENTASTLFGKAENALSNITQQMSSSQSTSTSPSNQQSLTSSISFPSSITSFLQNKSSTSNQTTDQTTQENNILNNSQTNLLLNNSLNNVLHRDKQQNSDNYIDLVRQNIEMQKVGLINSVSNNILEKQELQMNQLKEIQEKENLLQVRVKMLQIAQERNAYKRKIIYTMVSLIFFFLILIFVIYVLYKRRLVIK